MLSTPPPIQSSPDYDFFSPSKVSNAVASSSPSVVVKTRTTFRPTPTPPYHRSSSSLSCRTSTSTPNSSPLSSPPSSTKRKSSPVSVSEPPREVKRLRGSAPKKLSRLPRLPSTASSKSTSRASSCQDSLPPSPEPIYRGSRSRSTSLFPGWDEDARVQPRTWITHEDGEPGLSHLSSEMVVKRLMKSYKPYFKNPNDPSDYSFKPHPTNYPVIELEYPNNGAVEWFVLLAPKDKDHYNPIMDLERSLYTIIECHLTRDQRALFGVLEGDTFSSLISPPSPSRPSPPHFSYKHRTSSHTGVKSSYVSPIAVIDSNGNSMSVFRGVQRAIHCQDGPLFLRAMAYANQLLRTLKYPPIPKDPFAPAPNNTLKHTIESWYLTGMPKKVLMRIIEENYQRSVGPHVSTLKQYEAFSSTVYGELMPSLAYEIIQLTRLNENSLFLDLGSGVGNVCAQASLQTGCKSYGIELMPGPAKIAREMKEHLRVRCKLWGVRLGEIELEEGNMLTSPRVNELIPKADVVLVDNKVFDESLNEALRPKFLDLKEGAFVISLKPFVSSINARVTERNVDDISAIFDVTERPYHSGSVSWGNGGGTYYIHRVDRGGYAEIRERFESSRTGSGKSTRVRR